MQTGSHIDPAVVEEFEDLMAATLCKELDQAGEERLHELVDGHSELGDRYQSYHRLQNFMTQLPMTSLDGSMLAGTSKISPDFIPDISEDLSLDDFPQPTNRTRVALMAGMSTIAAATIIAISVLIFRDVTTSGSKRMLTFPHRNCESGGQAITTARDMPGNDLQSGSNSFCDAEILGAGNQVAFRIFPESSIRIEEESDGLHLHLDRGRIYLNARRSPDRHIQVHTTGHQISILGTEVMITRENETDLHVELVRGQVEVHSATYMHLKNMRKSLPHKTERILAKDMPELFESKVFILESGNSVYLKRPGGLTNRQKELLKKLDQNLETRKSKQDPSSLSQNSIYIRIKNELEINPEILKELKTSQLIAKHNKIDSKRKWLLQRWAQKVAFLENSKKLKESFDKKKETIKSEQILKDLKTVQASSLLYKIYLKDGRSLTGMIIQQGNNYHLITDQGDSIIPISEVKTLDPIFE